MQKQILIAEKLVREHSLSAQEWRVLLEDTDKEVAEYLCRQARQETDRIFGRRVFVRGLIEFTNICKKDCFYCGIRKSNLCVERYRLSEGFRAGTHCILRTEKRRKIQPD